MESCGGGMESCGGGMEFYGGGGMDCDSMGYIMDLRKNA